METPTIHGIDLTAPDGVEKLMDFHRLTFGDAVMRANAGAGDGGDSTGDQSGSGDGGGDGDGTDGQSGSGDGAGADGDAGDGGDGNEDLGDAGKKALDAVRAERNAAKKEARELRQKLADREAADAAKDKPAEEQALDQARREAAAEATAKANERILRSDVKAAAAGKLKNPELAVKLLDMSQFEADASGDFDSEQINDAIAELLRTDPYLAATANTTQFDSARGRKPAGVTQLTNEDLNSMSSEQILKARKEGRLDTLLGRRS